MIKKTPRPRGYWTKERLKEEALKYKRRSDFQNNSKSAYEQARSTGILDECCSHMMNKSESLEFIGKKLLSYEKMKEIALSCLTRKELNEKHKAVMKKIKKLKLEKELLSHMKKYKPERYWTDERIIQAIYECQTKSNLRLKYGRAYNLTKSNKEKFDPLFKNLTYEIETKLLHPKINKIFKKYNKKIRYQPQLIINTKKVIPDFIYETENLIYVIEAKTSARNDTHVQRLEDQIKEQIEYTQYFYPNKKITHIVLSEMGWIKAKSTDFNMSLKEFDYFIKNSKYKKMTLKLTRKEKKQEAIKIRNEFIKKFINPIHQEVGDLHERTKTSQP